MRKVTFLCIYYKLQKSGVCTFLIAFISLTISDDDGKIRLKKNESVNQRKKGIIMNILLRDDLISPETDVELINTIIHFINE
jgi:hypothetical protein